MGVCGWNCPSTNLSLSFCMSNKGLKSCEWVESERIREEIFDDKEPFIEGRIAELPFFYKEVIKI